MVCLVSWKSDIEPSIDAFAQIDVLSELQESDKGHFQNQDSIISPDVQYWKDLFDDAWDNPSTSGHAFGKARAMFYAKSGGDGQQYYYLAWQLDAVIQIWQATGDNKYLEDALSIIETCIGSAKDVRGGKYKGWPVSNLKNYNYVKNGVPLYESYLFRYVATLLRVMHQSPNLRANGYQERYDAILAFTEKHIWEKWYSKSSSKSDIYRVNAHMTSHWARIAMELYIITGEAIYKNVFDNISFAGIPKYSGANLRDKLMDNPKYPTAYTWSTKWEGSRVQDTSHGADIVSFMTNAYENGMYWNTHDMEALLNTLHKVVWTGNSPLKFTANVDGTGGSNSWDAGFHNFITLGRFSEEVQQRIKLYYSSRTVRYKNSEAFGIAALNRKILNDGRPIYPENYGTEN